MLLKDIELLDIEKELQEVSPLFLETVSIYQSAFGGSSNKTEKGTLRNQMAALLKFANGEQDLDDAAELCELVCRLYWKLPWQSSYQVQWQMWEETVVGLIVRAALARIKLIEGRDLSGPEVALLCNLTISGVSRATSQGRLIGQKNGRQNYYSAVEVMSFMKR